MYALLHAAFIFVVRFESFFFGAVAAATAAVGVVYCQLCVCVDSFFSIGSCAHVTENDSV